MVIVLFSGGLDSTTCLAEAIKIHGRENVIALSIYYGQKHRKEIEAAEKIVKYYGVKWEQLDLSYIFAGSECSLLASSAEAIPDETYAEQLRKTDGKPVSTYVPFRNGLFLAAATSIAIAKGCRAIYYGIHQDDAAGNAYPDCSEIFNQCMNLAIFFGSGQTVEIIAPFVDKTKADIVKRGIELGVPYELTWSCYKGEEKPCGVCGTCRDRARAFELNGIKDPAIIEK